VSSGTSSGRVQVSPHRIPSRSPAYHMYIYFQVPILAAIFTAYTINLLIHTPNQIYQRGIPRSVWKEVTSRVWSSFVRIRNRHKQVGRECSCICFIQIRSFLGFLLTISVKKDTFVWPELDQAKWCGYLRICIRNIMSFTTVTGYYLYDTVHSSLPSVLAAHCQ
jgi:hypothetical protein